MTGLFADIARTKSGPSRDAAVREVLRNNFDMAYMARVALGSHWAEASEALRARFLAALEAAEARAYGDRLTKLAASDVTIDKVDARPNGVSMVKAVLTQANGQTTRIEWEVHDNGRGARIADLQGRRHQHVPDQAVGVQSLHPEQRRPGRAAGQGTGSPRHPLSSRIRISGADGCRC